MDDEATDATLTADSDWKESTGASDYRKEGGAVPKSADKREAGGGGGERSRVHQEEQQLGSVGSRCIYRSWGPPDRIERNTGAFFGPPKGM
jgi:hypothetical protein